MILYDHPLSPYAQKVRIMLREKKQDFEAVIPEGLGSGEDRGYSRYNPRLEVPALVVNGTTLFDSTIILEYLEDAFPDPPLRPADPLARARCRLIEEVCDTHYEAINWGLGELRFFKRGGDQAAALRASAGKDTAAIQNWLQSQICDSGWLTGDQFGWADLVAVPYVTMSQIFGFEPNRSSKLNTWLEKVTARPAVAHTIAEAAASVPGMDAYSGMLDRGGMRRHFRDHRLEWMIRAGGLQVVLDGLANDNIRFTDIGRFSSRH